VGTTAPNEQGGVLWRTPRSPSKVRRMRSLVRSLLPRVAAKVKPTRESVTARSTMR
jgi:hypothetical protein